MPAEPLDDLVALYTGPDARRFYDEDVTELDHALQAAALARGEGAVDAQVAAALLHDVGHLIVGDLFSIDEELDRDYRHERSGARFLSRWFGAAVTEPVRLHVAAKRYLCATDPGYGDALSASSVRSLDVQGGVMTPAEVDAFEADPASDAAVAVRRWDDRAKQAGLTVDPFERYLDLLGGLVGTSP